MFCTKCGTKLEENAAFCHSCGASAEMGETANTSAQQDIPMYECNELAEQLVKVKTEYYMPKFADMKLNTKSVSWNWCAFLVPVYWLLYRKMYVETAIMLVANYVLTILGGASIIIHILLGLFGNWLYMQHIDRRAAEAAKLGETEKQDFISKKSGVNKIAVAVLIVLNLILIGVIAAFVYAFMLYV